MAFAAGNAQPFGARNSVGRVWAECSTIASIVRLSFSGDPARSEQIEQVIYLGSSRTRSQTKRLAAAWKLSLFVTCLLAPRLAVAQEVLTPIDLFDAQSSPGVRVASALA